LPQPHERGDSTSPVGHRQPNPPNGYPERRSTTRALVEGGGEREGRTRRRHTVLRKGTTAGHATRKPHTAARTGLPAQNGRPAPRNVARGDKNERQRASDGGRTAGAPLMPPANGRPWRPTRAPCAKNGRTPPRNAVSARYRRRRHAQPSSARLAPSAKRSRQRRRAQARLCSSGGRTVGAPLMPPQKTPPMAAHGAPRPHPRHPRGASRQEIRPTGTAPCATAHTANAAQLPAKERGGPHGNGGAHGVAAHPRRQPTPRPKARRDGTLPQSRPQAEVPNSWV
jgi:hypothetical protein